MRKKRIRKLMIKYLSNERKIKMSEINNLLRRYTGIKVALFAQGISF